MTEKKELKPLGHRKTLRYISSLIWTVSLIPLFMGFHRLYAYRNEDWDYEENVNTHVGGDAYNFIINGTHATAFFVLFGSLLIAGFLAEILRSTLPEEEDDSTIKDIH